MAFVCAGLHNLPYHSHLPPQFASSHRKSLERLKNVQAVRSCRQINVGSGGAAAGVIFFFVVTTLLGSAQSRYLSSPLLLLLL